MPMTGLEATDRGYVACVLLSISFQLFIFESGRGSKTYKTTMTSEVSVVRLDFLTGDLVQPMLNSIS